MHSAHFQEHARAWTINTISAMFKNMFGQQSNHWVQLDKMYFLPYAKSVLSMAYEGCGRIVIAFNKCYLLKMSVRELFYKGNGNLESYRWY